MKTPKQVTVSVECEDVEVNDLLDELENLGMLIAEDEIQERFIESGMDPDKIYDVLNNLTFDHEKTVIKKIKVSKGGETIVDCTARVTYLIAKF